MNTWLQACDNARQSLKTTAGMLLDNMCSELFDIVEVLSKLAEEACEKDSGAAGCGMCAAYYRLAGSVKTVADVAMQALNDVDNLGSDSVDDESTTPAWQNFLLATTQSHEQLMQKVRDHQDAVRDFAKALQNDCHNELMHLTSEIMVLLEHPFVVTNDSFHSCLQAQHDALERYVEWFYEMGDLLNEHPVLDIDAEISK